MINNIYEVAENRSLAGNRQKSVRDSWLFHPVIHDIYNYPPELQKVFAANREAKEERDRKRRVKCVE